MPLLQLDSLDLSFGEQIIFDKLNLQLDKGQRIGLIGRNGEGKSTLLRTIQGLQEIDSGTIYRDPSIRIAAVAQDLPPSDDTTVKDYVAQGAADTLSLLAEFDEMSQDESVDLDQLQSLQQKIEALDGWNFEHRLQKVLQQFDLDPEQVMNRLSGGWRRKVSIARALLVQPDVLLLDEPTNHLDIGLINWLEGFIPSFSGAVVLITHDRAFLRKVCNEIAEIDRGILRTWKGSYDDFLRFKKQALETEEKHNALFDKRLSEEEAWIRQGIKARRTRNEGRVRALVKLRQERSQRRDRKQLGQLAISNSQISGKLVSDIEAMSFHYADKTIVKDFTATILRGDKVGFIGPNGVGKSTLLKLIIGDLEPSAGKIKRGTALQIAYFDQMRNQIDLEKNIVDNVGQGRQSVTINGKEKHILSYLQDFLFSPKRARTPVKALSGGECSRVMLAKLFCQPSNLLIMDEPTNDLDAETLELLESLLVEYTGTVLLVTHDREFLDNVATSSFVFEGKGAVREYVGGYSDWLNQGGSWERIVGTHSDYAQNARPANHENFAEEVETPDKITAKTPAETAADAPHAARSTEATGPAKKLSYKLQRELDALPDELAELEDKKEALLQCVSAEGFYQGDNEEVKKTLTELADLDQRIEKKYARWQELEG